MKSFSPRTKSDSLNSPQAQRRADARMEKLEGSYELLESFVKDTRSETRDHFAETDRRLAEIVREANGRGAETDKRLAALAVAQVKTDEQVKALVAAQASTDKQIKMLLDRNGSKPGKKPAKKMTRK